MAVSTETKSKKRSGKLKKSERRKKILLELKLRPHVRIKELARDFNVSTETLRRDLDALAIDGLIDRAYGGASASGTGQYPTLGERTAAHVAERERIAQLAANEVLQGETLMIDSGSTTIELAKALAYRGVACTVITNSLPVAMIMGQEAANVMLCPGEYLASENAVMGSETQEYLQNFRVDRCFLGASGMTEHGLFDTVPAIAGVKREMLRCAAQSHLLIGSDKFGQHGLVRFAGFDAFQSIISDARPTAELLSALEAGQAVLRVAEQTSDPE